MCTELSILSTDQASGALPSMTCLEVLKSEYSSVHDLCVVCDAALFALPSLTISVRSLNGFPLGRTDSNNEFVDLDDWVIDLMMDAQHLSSLLATVSSDRVRVQEFEAEDAWYYLNAKPGDVLAPLHGLLSNVPVLGFNDSLITPHQVREFAGFLSNAEVVRLQWDKWSNCTVMDIVMACLTSFTKLKRLELSIGEGHIEVKPGSTWVSSVQLRSFLDCFSCQLLQLALTELSPLPSAVMIDLQFRTSGKSGGTSGKSGGTSGKSGGTYGATLLRQLEDMAHGWNALGGLLHLLHVKSCELRLEVHLCQEQ